MLSFYSCDLLFKSWCSSPKVVTRFAGLQLWFSRTVWLGSLFAGPIAAQLLLEKKSRLLRQLEEPDDDTGAADPTHVGDASSITQDAVPPLLKSGDLCRVPYRHAWGGFQVGIWRYPGLLKSLQ